ncbi:MAG: SurA N-terminal domain-containing protein [Acidobacteriota bacterium]
MQSDAFFRVQTRFALCTLMAVVALTAGCHRTPGADVVATVNGKDISRAELEQNYKAEISNNPQQQPSPEQADILRLNLLHGMIEDEILQQRAAKLNLTASDEDVNAKLTELKAPFTQEEFEQKLKERGQTVEDLKRVIRRTLTKTKLLNKEILSKINITDAEISEYYNTHKADFNWIEPSYRLAQIVVTGAQPQANGTPGRPNQAQALKEIDSIQARLQSGEDFGSLAAQFSVNANIASNGGDMGYITETQLKQEPDLYNAIVKLRPGQITDVIPVYDPGVPGHKILGYSIYKLISREAAGQRGLNDPGVQQTIRDGLRNSKAQVLQNAYFEMLHDDAKVRNYFAEQVLKAGAQ